MRLWPSKDDEQDAVVHDAQEDVTLSATDTERLRHEIAALRDLAGELLGRAAALERLSILRTPSPQAAGPGSQDKIELRRSTGTVKWFDQDKGYGYITPDEEGPEVFAHFSGIDAHGFRNLAEGQRVEFEITPGAKGPQAIHIRVRA